MPDVKTLYEEDTVAWAEQQVVALRSAARTGSNQLLDWENLAEEIEGLSKSLRLTLGSQIFRIIHHLFKLEHSPSSEPRDGWRRSIRQARHEIGQLLEDSPSLRREVPRIVARQTPPAIEFALTDLAEHDEIGALDLPLLRRHSYTDEQIVGDWLPRDAGA